MNLTPFLVFDGNCAEAMAFYYSCFGGDVAGVHWFFRGEKKAQ